MRVIVGRALAFVAVSFALTACDLNPRPEDPGSNQSKSPSGDVGHGAAGTGGSHSNDNSGPPAPGAAGAGASGEMTPVIGVHDAGTGFSGGNRTDAATASDAGKSDAAADGGVAAVTH
jgi:hypothetical protein